jgi:sterol desaturase/sphingolipid hydroxylase (fatty acid hydroxylase superfamily)
MLNPSSETISYIFLLCASLGFALFADWAKQKWERIFLGLGIVAVLLQLERIMFMGGWLLLSLILLGLLIESLAFRRWYYNWASKETLTSLGIGSCSRLLVIAVQALIFGNLMEDLPPGTGSWGFAVTGAALWLQVLVILVLLDFKKYWFHRLDHSVIFFWRFHKIHHGVSELHCLSPRNHPIYNLGHIISDIGIVYLIGVTKEAFAISIVVYAIFAGLIAHINWDFPRCIDGKLPWFAYLIATPNVHAWHHTIHCRYDANLGDVFYIWDVLFGTFEVPRGNSCDWQFGLLESEQLPPSVLGQLMSPFTNLEKTHLKVKKYDTLTTSKSSN